MRAREITETTDYFRRREREEKIISGEKPARKKQPSQTSDYARRREQERKKEQGVAEGRLPVVTYMEVPDELRTNTYDAPYMVIKSQHPDFERHNDFDDGDMRYYQGKIDFQIWDPDVKEGVSEYGTHPSQRVDPRTGKKYVPPKSPLGKGVAEGSQPPVCKHCGKRQGEHQRGKCPKGTKTAVGYTDYGPTKFEPKEPKQQGVAEGTGGNWYIRVNGKILNDTKFKPVIFSSEDEARSHAMKLADKKRIPLSQIKLTKSWMDAPGQGVAEGF